jgi:selenide,water dikinase
MGPEALAQVLRKLSPPTDPNLLVGHDDAAIYHIGGDISLALTVDFFPPIVDDPFAFGAIAVANSLSDIYAMGAKPILGLNIVCFPADLPHEILVSILQGGESKAMEAGVLIVGGHTIDDKEPKYGLAVTGIVKTGQHITFSGARPGDNLILTKPLGTGIITTAAKTDNTSEEILSGAIKIMSKLNKDASEAMLRVGATACTDITGFGLMGHLRNMLQDGIIGAELRLSQVPTIEGAWDLAQKGIAPGGTLRNLESIMDSVVWHKSVSHESMILLSDAQTSGGLLIAIEPEKTNILLEELKASGVTDAAIIGKMTSDAASRIRVLP